jgi:hypothetical protein
MIRRQGPILTLVACALVLLGAALPAAPAGAAMLVNVCSRAERPADLMDDGANHEYRRQRCGGYFFG